jgi:hypothetical protein
MHDTRRSFPLPALIAVALYACGEEIARPAVVADSVVPTILAVDPAPGDTGVSVEATIRVTFSEPVNPATVAVASFMVFKDLDAVAGTRRTDGTMAVFVPDTAFAELSTYAVALTVAIRDLAGNPLAADTAWGFVTGRLPPIDPRPCGGPGCAPR